MKLASTRTLDSLRPTLMDVNCQEPKEVYWVFSELSNDKFANLTVIVPGKLGSEFPKTFGHYHSVAVLETYLVVLGEGVVILQKKTDEPNCVLEVLLVKAHQGDKITIPPEYGHSWSNVSNSPLILLDDWRFGHSPTDYQVMESLRGMSYYLTGEINNIVPVANKNYVRVPAYRLIEAKDLKL